MSWFTTFLVSLAISVVFSFISYLLTPPPQSISSPVPEPGELGAPTADEGIPIPHMRGTRFMAVNCLWWTPTGNSPIIK